MQDNIVISESDIRNQAQKDGITHISTGVAIIKDGKVLLARRAVAEFLGGSYELPGGGVGEGESITEVQYEKLRKKLS